MFDFFKRRSGEMPDDTENKKKHDKAFIGTVIFLAVFAVISLVTGIRNDSFAEMNVHFNFSVTDMIMLGGGIVAYAIYKFWKGGNE